MFMILTINMFMSMFMFKFTEMDMDMDTDTNRNKDSDRDIDTNSNTYPFNVKNTSKLTSNSAGYQAPINKFMWSNRLFVTYFRGVSDPSEKS
jgi:hypothetical protein